MFILLDLKSLLHCYLQIHYDRVGKDGLFSHKEVTVLFVPDLSECLPSLDEWRAQWLAHRKAVSERERQLSLKREVLFYFIFPAFFVRFPAPQLNVQKNECLYISISLVKKMHAYYRNNFDPLMYTQTH